MTSEPINGEHHESEKDLLSQLWNLGNILKAAYQLRIPPFI